MSSRGSPHTPLQRFGITFCAIEAVAGLSWWAALAASSDLRPLFFPAPVDPLWFGALGLADGILYVGTAAAASVGLAGRRPWSGGALWLHAGAATYAGLLAIGLWWQDPTLWRGALSMLPSTVLPLLLAARLGRP
ncbi:MAG: hypothetical protein ACO3RU_12525 [Planctomycetota bacterium]